MIPYNQKSTLHSACGSFISNRNSPHYVGPAISRPSLDICSRHPIHPSPIAQHPVPSTHCRTTKIEANIIVAHVLASALIVILALLSYLYLSLHANTASRPYTSHPSMAWFSGGATNAALVNNLAKNGLINSERVKNAMHAVRALRTIPSMCLLLLAFIWQLSPLSK